MKEIKSEQRPRWSVLEALLVFAVILSMKWLLPLSQMSWFNYLSKLISPANVYLGQVFLNSFIIAVFFFFLIGLIIKQKYHLAWGEVGLKRGIGENWLLVAIGQGILLFAIMAILTTFISLLFPFEVEEQVIVDVFITAVGWREKVLCLLIVAVAAPFSEELYFRGFLYPAVSKIIGKLPAVIITSAFFGFLHFDLVRFIPITIGGIWLNMLYLKTDSLYTPILAHAVWNILMICLLFFAQSARLI